MDRFTRIQGPDGLSKLTNDNRTCQGGEGTVARFGEADGVGVHVWRFAVNQTNGDFSVGVSGVADGGYDCGVPDPLCWQLYMGGPGYCVTTDDDEVSPPMASPMAAGDEVTFSIDAGKRQFTATHRGVTWIVSDLPASWSKLYPAVLVSGGNVLTVTDYKFQEEKLATAETAIIGLPPAQRQDAVKSVLTLLPDSEKRATAEWALKELPPAERHAAAESVLTALPPKEKKATVESVMKTMPPEEKRMFGESAIKQLLPAQQQVAVKSVMSELPGNVRKDTLVFTFQSEELTGAGKEVMNKDFYYTGYEKMLKRGLAPDKFHKKLANFAGVAETAIKANPPADALAFEKGMREVPPRWGECSAGMMGPAARRMCSLHSCARVFKHNFESGYEGVSVGDGMVWFFGGMFDQRNGKSISRWMMEANFHMKANNIFVLDICENRSYSAVIVPFYTDEFDDALKMMQQPTLHGVVTMVGADGTHHAVAAEGVQSGAIKVWDPLDKVTTVTAAEFINFILPGVSISKAEGPEMSEAPLPAEQPKAREAKMIVKDFACI